MTHGSSNPLDKPLLNQEAFQQLLAAAFTLQEQNDQLPMKEAKADSPQTHAHWARAENVIPRVSLPPEPLAETGLRLQLAHPMIHSDIKPPASLADWLAQPQRDARVSALAQKVQEAAIFKPPKAKPPQPKWPVRHATPSAPNASRDRMMRTRISQGNELFWRAATILAVAAISALLLAASINQLTPLPAGLSLPSEAVRQQVPFRKAKRTATVPAQSGRVGSKSTVMERQATTDPAERTVIADQPPGKSATPPSPEKTIVNPRRAHSTYESEADLVAPDTVVRYGPRSAAPRLQAEKKP